MIIEDLKGDRREQPSWRIAVYNTGEFIKTRLLPFCRWILIYLFVTTAVSGLFSIAYQSILQTHYQDVQEKQLISNPSNFTSILRDSFLIFENLPIFTSNGQPEMLQVASAEQQQSANLARTILQELSAPMLIERVIGVLVNAILIAVVTSIALKPINPIWLAPRFMLIGNDIQTSNLAFKYWIRYPEDKWLHRFVLTIRILSDAADRSIENKNETEYEITFERIMRRGMCEFHIPLLQSDSDGVNSFESEKLVDILSKMVIARFGKANQAYKIWDEEERKLVECSRDELRQYRDYQINFRVAGSTDDGYEVASEKKYSIDDLLFNFDFMPAEVPEHLAELTHAKVIGLPWSEEHRYRFFYRNIWKAVPSYPNESNYQHPGIDMTRIEMNDARIENLLDYLDKLGQRIDSKKEGNDK